MLDNLRFVLGHEPELQGCEKRWVLNRIADEDVEGECIDLIESAGHGYIRIPFVLDDYATYFLDGSDMLKGLRLSAALRKSVLGSLRTWALEWQYRQKSLYAISLNVARNLALDEGRRLGRWTLPWDGSCFVTAQAWREIVRLAASDTSALYLIVPLARIEDNGQLLRGEFRPGVLTEPQIAFRDDSSERFNESLRYGHLDKAELLKILEVPGPWHEWRMAPWEAGENRVSAERGRFAQGGWVARLQAGCNAMVESNEEARWKSRFRGVQLLCHQLDKRVIIKSLASDPLICYARETLAASVDRSSLNYDLVIHAAREALRCPMPSILDKRLCSPSGDKRDYLSISDSFESKRDTSIVCKFGPIKSESFLLSEASGAFDRNALDSFITRTCATSLAGALTGDRVYFQYAASLLKIWFITDRTRMNPHMKYAQITPRKPLVDLISGIADLRSLWRTAKDKWQLRKSRSLSGIVDFRGLWPMIDAIRLVKQSGELTEDEFRSIKIWFSTFLDTVTCHNADWQLNNVGNWFDLVTVSISAFIGNSGHTAWTLSTAPLRIAAQLSACSAPHLELQRAKPLHYSLFHLQALISLAWLGRSLGIDLWKYTASFNRSIAMEARYIALNRCCFSDYAAESDTYDKRIAAAIRSIPSDAANYEQVAVLDLADCPSIIDNPNFGIPPFWPAFRVPCLR